jgi:hypothetical protein
VPRATARSTATSTARSHSASTGVPESGASRRAIRSGRSGAANAACVAA